MEDLKKLLGDRIKAIRRSKRMSQQELAEKAVIDQRSLSHIECGDNFPSKCLVDIANALETPLPELFSFKKNLISKDEMINSINEIIEELSFNELKIVYRVFKKLK